MHAIQKLRLAYILDSKTAKRRGELVAKPQSHLTTKKQDIATLQAELDAMRRNRDMWANEHERQIEEKRDLADELSAMSAENTMLRQHAAQQITDGTLITGLNIGAGGFDLGLQGGAAQLLAESLAQQFKDGGGINYLELRFESSQALPGEKFVVTIQRVEGLTPAQKLAAMTAERDTAHRKPLTDAEISEIYFEALGQQHLQPKDRLMVGRFARAIEQHHGITEGQP